MRRPLGHILWELRSVLRLHLDTRKVESIVSRLTGGSR